MPPGHVRGGGQFPSLIINIREGCMREKLKTMNASAKSKKRAADRAPGEAV